MQFFTDSNMQFQLVELTLNQGETVFYPTWQYGLPYT